MIENLGNIRNANLLVVGDFNKPDIVWSDPENIHATGRNGEKFLQCVQDAYLTQHVTQPTRYRGDQKRNTLDLILSNQDDCIDNLEYIPPLGKSDHCGLLFNMLVTEEVKNNEKKEIYHYNKANFDVMRQDMQEVMWDSLETMDVEEGWKFISEKIENVSKKQRTKVKIGTRKKKALWMNKEALVKVRRKHAAWKRYLETKDGEDYLKYTKARNQARWETRKSQREYEKKVAKDVKKNPKAFWKYVNSKCKFRSKIPDLERKDKSRTSDDQEKAELLNDYFKEAFTEEDTANLPNIPNKNLDSHLSNIDITEDMVYKKLSGLNPNKSAGPDGIQAVIIKELSKELTKPLTILFKKSINTGKLPNGWKKAHVTPIHKKDSKHNPGNYRAVCLTVLVCKVLESIVKDFTMGHLTKHNLISEHQHGFLKGRTTDTNLIETLDYWIHMLNEGENLDVVYCDFRKAFDSVPHERLMLKVRNYGIDGQLANWIEDFITGREQRVCINGKSSRWVKVTSGVPQGSVLGPLLFVIFINDLPESILSGVKMYADDTKIFQLVNNEEQAKKLQEEIDKLYNWSQVWQLLFHPDKCHILHLGNKSINHEYYMGTDQNKIKLNPMEAEKDLGVTVDNKLTFSEH